MGTDFFTTASFGKRVEYMVIATMLRDGLDIYLPMVDDKGIDCLIRKEDASVSEIQIKGRSKKCDIRNAGRFSAMSLRPREGYYLVFYSEACGPNGTMWLMHSPDFAELAVQNKSGSNSGKYSILLCGTKQDGEGDRIAYPLPKFQEYIVEKFSEDLFRHRSA